MKTRIVRIGNSQGVRIPKPLLAAAGIEGEVELQVEEGRIVIQRAAPPREGWEEAARRMVEAGEAAPLLEGAGPTDFDLEEWTWDGAWEAEP
ncbi:MAG: AbrB/MazE/SpoVT family DNA-binding domain-containing protein [Longimicrobiales bacterium]|nr:AbrB/MazE/SpoVT family DNA-binding domain-containing protein [Longimicrobiales bacterium]